MTATNEVLRSGQLVDGTFKLQLEKYIALKLNVKYVHLCHSGTQALNVLAEAKRILSKNIEPNIILPDVSYIATYNAFLRAGYNITLADVDAYGMIKWSEVDRIREQNPNSKYDLCIVGLYGSKPLFNNVNYNKLDRKVRNSDVHQFEDGAQHWLGGMLHNSSAMTLSFDPSKNLHASGHGGAIVTDMLIISEQVKELLLQGGDFTNGGINSKLSEIDCSHILVRAKYLTEWQNRRKQIAAYWIESFADTKIENLVESNIARMNAYHSVNKFAISVPDRDKLKEYLSLHGIETKIHYINNFSSSYKLKPQVKCDFLSNSYQFVKHTLSLPIYPELTDIEVDYIRDTVKSFYK